MSDSLMVIHEYMNDMEALVAQSVLEAHGIHTTLLREDAGGMLPSMNALYPWRLAVGERDAELAVSILESPVEPADDAAAEAAAESSEGGKGDGSGGESES